MKDNSFIIIKGWMINRLELKLPELIVYGYIYGYTQNGKQWYEGSFKDISDDLKFIKKRWIIEIMKRLISAGLIEKKRDGNTNKYRVIIGQNLSVFDSAQNAQPDPPTSAQNAQPLVRRMHFDYLSNIYNNLYRFLKVDKLTNEQDKFVKILLDEIWIDQNLKRLLFGKYKNFEKEVLPILEKFIKNKLGGGDIAGRPGHIRTNAFSYIQTVLSNKKQSADNDAGPKLDVL